MMKNNQIVCPICGKVGIGDYYHEDVVCSCCGTDLSIYRMLHNIQKIPQSTPPSVKTWKITTVVLSILIIIGASSWCMFLKKSSSPLNSDNSKELSILRDSINVLNNDLSKARKELLKRETENRESEYLIYIVKKKDSPCLISRKLYGTEKRYKEIEDVLTKPLEPGDTLKLKR